MDIEIVERLSKEQIQDLHYLYKAEWWTKERNLTDIQQMVENSDVIVGLCQSKTKELIGFTRVITDYTYKALVLDVIVKESYRGKHLGKMLMDTIFNHPSLTDVKHFELYCRPEMLEFYRNWGFTENLGELHFMRKVINK